MFSPAAYAQDVAAVDPTVTLPSIDAVYKPCEIVSMNPGDGDVTDGICIGATQTYLAALEGLPVDSKDKAISDMVFRIAPLAQADGVCNKFDDEVAAAVRLAAAATTNPELLAQLIEIAQTIKDDCAKKPTAALPVSPA
jgi:hypothetical protein